jgi:hypothetical protein
MATTPNNNPVPTPDTNTDDMIDLASIMPSLSKRGRKSEVDPTLVQRLMETEPGKGWVFPESTINGPEYQDYIGRKSAPKVKDDGKLETPSEARQRAHTSFQARQRQRAQAVAAEAGIDPVIIRWTVDGRLIVGRPAQA